MFTSLSGFTGRDCQHAKLPLCGGRGASPMTPPREPLTLIFSLIPFLVYIRYIIGSYFFKANNAHPGDFSCNPGSLSPPFSHECLPTLCLSHNSRSFFDTVNCFLQTHELYCLAGMIRAVHEPSLQSWRINMTASKMAPAKNTIINTVIYGKLSQSL